MLHQTVFRVGKMDCPSEVEMINLKIARRPEVKQLDFNVNDRILKVIHEGDISQTAEALYSLGLDSRLEETAIFQGQLKGKEKQQYKVLILVLLINFGFFLIEFITGWISESMGLVADSLDMLSDALVYGLSLLAISRTAVFKKRVAKAAGYLQITLAALGFAEVTRRFLGAAASPDFSVMIGISFLALLANALCLYLLKQTQSSEAHMRASMIFTSNDIVINAGVILSGVLVWLTSSQYPDLMIGGLVFILVMRGALRILKLG
jgi:Co/Zn/Cd efflux system component